jgi:hypothetical protein
MVLTPGHHACICLQVVNHAYTHVLHEQLTSKTEIDEWRGEFRYEHPPSTAQG